MINESYIKGKKNIILSGWKLRKDNKIKFSQDNVNQFQDIIEKIDIQDYIKKMVDEAWKSQFEGKNVLGVFLRGTDYVALKPTGHNVQPTISQMISKIEEFLEKYNNDKIFVVTEDYSYFMQLQEKFGDRVFSYSNQFIENYSGTDYIEKDFSDDSYQRGLQYLIRILLLSRCEYQICSIASGSSFSRLFRLESPRDEYWFDLGLYE